MLINKLSILTDNLSSDLQTIATQIAGLATRIPTRKVTLSTDTLTFDFSDENEISVKFSWTGPETIHLLNQLVSSLGLPFVAGDGLLLAWTLTGGGAEASRKLSTDFLLVFDNPDYGKAPTGRRKAKV